MLFLISCFLVYYFLLNGKTTEAPQLDDTFETINHAELPLINIATINKDIPDENIRIIKEIPNVKILSNQLSSTKANDYINRFIEDEENEFLKAVSEIKPNASGTQNIINSLSLNSEVVLNTPNVFAIKFKINELFTNSLKPIVKVKYILFDITRGKTLLFPEIIKSEVIYEVIKNNSNVDPGQILSVLKTNNSFFIDKNALYISIDSASTKDDISEIKIPFELISPYLREEILSEIISDKEYIRMSEPENN